MTDLSNLSAAVQDAITRGLQHAHEYAQATHNFGLPAMLAGHWIRNSEHTAGRWQDPDVLAAMAKIEAEAGYAAQTEIANNMLRIIVAYLNAPDEITALVANAQAEYAAAPAAARD